MNDRPLLLLSDSEGRVFEHPSFRSMGRSGPQMIEVYEWIPLPEGSKLFSLPGRVALGWDDDTQQLQRVSDIWDRNRNFAPTPVAAFLPPGYVRTHLPATEILPDVPILPTWAYACVAWYQDKFVAAAYRIDANEKWQPDQYDDRDLLPRIQELSAEFPQNRLLTHLAHCATHYHCFAAKNLFFGRWEAPLPVAPTSPAMFSLDRSGFGPGAILNQDYSVNGPGNRAAPGSVIQIFATGEGQTNPPGVDGKLATGALPAPNLPVSVTIGGLPAIVPYAGAAPGLVAGVVQVNAVVPLSIASGSAVPVFLRFGGATSPRSVTVAIE